jgi:ABC-2 type transport system permease protein
MAALLSSCDSQRWRTVGLMTGWYVLATICEIVGRVADGWQWLKYVSLLTAYAPEAMVSRSNEAWSVLTYQDGSISGLGLGGCSLLLLAIGLSCYLAGAVIFNRRELPAPI